MKTRQQARQERNLQAAKNQYRKDKEELKAIRLMPEGKLARQEKRGLSPP